MKIEGTPDRLGGSGLAGMRGQTKFVIGGIGVNAAEQLRRSFDLIAPNADADHVAILVAHCQFEHLLRLFHAEVTRGIENPEQGYSEVASASGASALQALEDRVEILFAVKTDPDRDINLGM